jgi:hypothetical protein
MFLFSIHIRKLFLSNILYEISLAWTISIYSVFFKFNVSANFCSLYFLFSKSSADCGRKGKKERKGFIECQLLFFFPWDTRKRKREIIEVGWGKITERKGEWGIGKEILATDVILIPWYPRKKSSPLNVSSWMPKSSHRK